MIAGRMAAIVVFSSLRPFCSSRRRPPCRLLSPTLLRRLEPLDPSSRADALFLLRVLPTVLAIVGVGRSSILPTFLWFEPSDSQERIPATMIVARRVAAACSWLRVAWRAVRALSVTRRLMRPWQVTGAQPSRSLDAPIRRVLRSTTSSRPSPSSACVGRSCSCPRSVLQECTPEETRAMILHECAHVEAHDNASPSAAARLSRFVRLCARLDKRVGGGLGGGGRCGGGAAGAAPCALACAGARACGPSGARAARRLCERALFGRQHRVQGPSAVVAAALSSPVSEIRGRSRVAVGAAVVVGALLAIAAPPSIKSSRPSSRLLP